MAAHVTNYHPIARLLTPIPANYSAIRTPRSALPPTAKTSPLYMGALWSTTDPVKDGHRHGGAPAGRSDLIWLARQRDRDIAEHAGTHSVDRSARKGGCSMSSHEAALQLIETDLLVPLAVVARGLVCEQMRQVDIF